MRQARTHQSTPIRISKCRDPVIHPFISVEYAAFDIVQFIMILPQGFAQNSHTIGFRDCFKNLMTVSFLFC